MGNTRGASQSGCLILVGLGVLTFGWMVVDGRREHQQEIARQEAAKVEDAKSCQVARTMSDDDVLYECQNAASLFGQDLSGDPVRLSICLERHQAKLAACEGSSVLEGE